MNSAHSNPPSTTRRVIGMLAAIGALVTGVFGWLGSIATTVTHPPMEAAVFLAAAALAFGLLALAALRS
ncbi:MAG: hypothetical protein ACYTFF_13725 [Planctomycetota bacterium]